MFKLLILLVGALTGGAATAAWLLSEPDGTVGQAAVAEPNSFRGRIDLARSRFEEASAVGRVAGDDTKAALQKKLDAYRSGR